MIVNSRNHFRHQIEINIVLCTPVVKIREHLNFRSNLLLQTEINEFRLSLHSHHIIMKYIGTAKILGKPKKLQLYKHLERCCDNVTQHSWQLFPREYHDITIFTRVYKKYPVFRARYFPCSILLQCIYATWLPSTHNNR